MLEDWRAYQILWTQAASHVTSQDWLSMLWDHLLNMLSSVLWTRMSFHTVIEQVEVLEENHVSCPCSHSCRKPSLEMVQGCSCWEAGVLCPQYILWWGHIPFRRQYGFSENLLLHMPIAEQNMLTSSCCFHYQFVLIGLTLFSLPFLCGVGLTLSETSLSCKPFMKGTCRCVESHRHPAEPG